MTIKIMMGRRMPRSWARRTATKASGLISFQENLWLIITQSLSLAKKRANTSGKIKFIMTKSSENEDLHYQLEWLNIVIQGSKEAEADEIKDIENFYAPLSKIFKKDMPVDDNLAKHFKTKKLGLNTIEDAYKKGYGCISNNNLANKMLEMGILMHYEIINDYDTRPGDV